MSESHQTNGLAAAVEPTPAVQQEEKVTGSTDHATLPTAEQSSSNQDIANLDAKTASVDVLAPEESASSTANEETVPLDSNVDQEQGEAVQSVENDDDLAKGSIGNAAASEKDLDTKEPEISSSDAVVTETPADSTAERLPEPQLDNEPDAGADASAEAVQSIDSAIDPTADDDAQLTAEPAHALSNGHIDVQTDEDVADTTNDEVIELALAGPLALSSEDKGKGKAKEEEKSPALSLKDEDGKESPEILPAIRYMLPIGGPPKSRNSTLQRSISSSAGPSNSKQELPQEAMKRSMTMADFDKRMEQERRRSLSDASSAASTIRSPTTATTRRPHTRRRSSSDIPSSLSPASKVGDDDEIIVLGGVQPRKRSHTLSERNLNSEKQNVKSRRRSRTMATSEDAKEKIVGRATRTGTVTSSLMIDGQMFFLDEDPSSKGAETQSAREAGQSDGSAAGYAVNNSDARATTKGSRRGLLDRATDLGGDLAFLTRAMRKPVRAQDEPMIYDADELDDIPPPGSYAIHPPSQRRLAEASALSLFDEDGNIVRFGNIFEHQRTLFIFLRHWLCPFCQMFAQSIKNVDPLPLQRADLGLVVVGQGHAHVTKSYKEVMKIPSYVKIYADPTRKIYHALGMTLRTNDAGPACMRPDYQTMGVMKASFKAVKHGLVDMPIRLPGDTKLLGGEFILGPGPECSFTHRMVTVRGHLDLPRILQQAGCDLSLKTPKDVLADSGDASLLNARPESTKSVDPITARKLARRFANKTRNATASKDTLKIRSKRAAEMASELSQRGMGTIAAGAKYTSTATLATLRRHDSSRTAHDKTISSSMSVAESQTNASTRDDPQIISSSRSAKTSKFATESAAVRARKSLANGFERGWARKNSNANRVKSPTGSVGGRTISRPYTADDAAERTSADNKDGLSSVSKPSLPTSSASSWTEERLPPMTARSLHSHAPPLPSSSSLQAYKAARERQGQNLDQPEELRSESESSLRQPLSANDLRRPFHLGSTGRNLSTSSLGRLHSFQTQYQRDQAHRKLELQDSMKDDHKPITPEDFERRAHRDRPATMDLSRSSRLNHKRSSSTQSLPYGDMASRASPLLPADSVGSPKAQAATAAAIRRNANRVPLSVFERRINDQPTGSLRLPPRISSTRESGYPVSATDSPMSSSFGEDTDYKRLPRSTDESRTSMSSDAQTTRASNGTLAVGTTPHTVGAEDKTPKARIISLHADELSLPPSSERSPHAEESREIFDTASAQREGTETPPPPVPPKEPRNFAPLMSPSTSTLSNAFHSTYASRAPVPAPTPAFAAILAAEEARRKNVTDAASKDKDDRAMSEISAASTAPATVIASAAPSSRLTTSSSMGAMPALLAGLPSYMPAPGAPTQGHARTNSQPQQSSVRQAQPGSAYDASKNTHEDEAQAQSSSDSNQALGSSLDAGSFLDDLETVDGFRRNQTGGRTSRASDSNFGRSPLTAFLGNASVSSEGEDEDDDETYYRQDWAPLQDDRNALRASVRSPDSSQARYSSSTNGDARHPANGSGDAASAEQQNGESFEDDEDYSENDTISEEGGNSGDAHASSPPSLALLGVLQKSARRISAPGNAVVKRVTSRPSTAPSSSDAATGTPNGSVGGGSSGLRGSLSDTLAGSARAIHINRIIRKPPQTAPSANGRRLSSFVEEEEEDEEDEKRMQQRQEHQNGKVEQKA